VKDPKSETWGTVYCIPDEEAASVLRNLDYREKGGYIREEVDVYISGREAPVVTKAILYIASEKNGNFLGESPLEDIATQIYKSVGPSGPNVDYLLNLAESMRKMNAIDSHVTELENLVVNLVKSSPLPHHTHPTLISLQTSKPFSDENASIISITTTTATTSEITVTKVDCVYSNDQMVPVNIPNCRSSQAEISDMQRKYFLSPTASVKGVICIDDGAVMAVSQRGRSLLAAGIVSVTGEFDPHNLVSVVDSVGTEIGRGMTTYSSDEILKIKGLHSTKISTVLGFSRGETVIHHHNMILI